MFGLKSHIQRFAPIILIGIIATGTFGPMVQSYQPQSAIRYVSGVTPGTSVEYSAHLKTSADVTGVSYAQNVSVRYVSGSKVEYKQSFSYQNGTTNAPVVSYLTDVRDGAETKFFDTFVFPSTPRPQFFFARDLVPGDPILDPLVAKQGFLAGLKVNGTKLVSYAGIALETDFLNAHLSQQGKNLSMYWDKSSGILLQFVLSGAGYIFSLEVAHIDLPSTTPILDPPVTASPGPGLHYRSMARVVVVGVKDISQDISFQAAKQGDTRDVQIPALPNGYKYGFVQLFGVASPAGISADFHGFDKVVIWDGKGDPGMLTNLAEHSSHRTDDGRPIIDVVTRNDAPQLTILHRDITLAGNSKDTKLRVYASLTTYKESYQEIEGNALPVHVPPVADSAAFDSLQIYVMVAPDSPLRVASIGLPNGSQVSPRIAIVLPKTAIIRASTELSGMYIIRFEEWYSLPLAGIIRVDRTGVGGVAPVHPGWSFYFTAASQNSTEHYYVADTSSKDGEAVTINAFEGYFVGAVSGYAYIGLPDVALLKSGSFERELLAILPPNGVASVTSFKPPGTMYMDFYLDASVPVSLIGRIKIVEGNSYIIQVAGLESGNHFGMYDATVRWNSFNLTVTKDGKPDAGIPVRVTDLAGNQLVEAKTDLQGSTELRVASIGPFVTQIGTQHSTVVANYFDSTNILAGPLTISLPSEPPLSSPNSGISPGSGAFDASRIWTSLPGLLGVLLAIVAYLMINIDGKKGKSHAS